MWPDIGKCEKCGHPLSAHTGTADTWPYLVCARTECGCQTQLVP